MPYQFSAQFLSEIIILAKEIAFHQRGERKLQEIETIDGKIGLKDKYFAELVELQNTSSPVEEIPDVVYYAVCLSAQGDGSALERELWYATKHHGLSVEQIEAITLAKYRIRAEGPNSKNFEREREAIQAALK